jgi:large subunit ribosomal protein L10
MNREEKAALVEEIAAQLSEAGAIFAVDYRGIGVPEAAELRGKLAESDASFRIVKNRLAKRAAESAGTEDITALFEGPTALTLVKGDPVTAAKTIADFARQHRVPTYKGGIMDGAPLDPEKFQRIARLPGLDVLHGQLVGVVSSPISGVARGLSQLLAGLAGQLGQIQEQGLVEGEAEAEAEQAEPEAEEPEAPEPEAPEPEAPEPEAPEAEAGSETGNEEEASPEDEADEQPTDEAGAE